MKELRISTLAEDGIAERSFYLRNSRLVTCTAPSSAVRGHGEGKGWENNYLKISNPAPNHAAGYGELWPQAEGGSGAAQPNPGAPTPCPPGHRATRLGTCSHFWGGAGGPQLTTLCLLLLASEHFQQLSLLGKGDKATFTL